ncbi:MAG: 1-acyl-sn-glycerol-3-phosphate acyltransferase [Bacteroidia bacterium]|nr:1-acyl-sn-glycerol-3-phosphate acyltransferase [Bacteroidia bacterium]
MIVAPHTSNWDFMVGLAARSILKIDTKYLGKKELFRFPFGGLFRYLGGYPVDRARSTNMVDEVVKIYDSHNRFSICIAPEGTREKTEKFKTGFYYIAAKLNIPVVMVGFDYADKEVRIREPFDVSGEIEKDMLHILEFFSTVKGKYPEKGIHPGYLENISFTHSLKL